MRYVYFIFQCIGYILSYIYTGSVDCIVQNIKYSFYAGLMTRRFKSFKGRFNGKIDLIGGEFIEIGKNSLLGKNLRLWAWKGFKGKTFQPSIKVGNNTAINSGCMLSCINSITIGDNVGIASNCVIIDNTHGDFREHKFTFKNNPEIPDVFLQGVHDRELYTKGPVVIEDGVHLGEGVIVMPGVRIGQHSIVSAHAVVTKKVPPYSIVAGDPASVVITFGKK